MGQSQQSRDDRRRQGDRSFDDSDQSEDMYNQDILDVRWFDSGFDDVVQTDGMYCSDTFNGRRNDLGLGHVVWEESLHWNDMLDWCCRNFASDDCLRDRVRPPPNGRGTCWGGYVDVPLLGK